MIFVFNRITLNSYSLMFLCLNKNKLKENVICLEAHLPDHDGHTNPI